MDSTLLQPTPSMRASCPHHLHHHLHVVIVVIIMSCCSALLNKVWRAAGSRQWLCGCGSAGRGQGCSEGGGAAAPPVPAPVPFRQPGWLLQGCAALRASRSASLAPLPPSSWGACMAASWHGPRLLVNAVKLDHDRIQLCRHMPADCCGFIAGLKLTAVSGLSDICRSGLVPCCGVVRACTNVWACGQRPGGCC